MYNHKEIEKKWQDFWDKNDTYKTENPNNTTKEKIYTLIEFPYPSGVGVHVGHVKGQTAVDIYARYKRMNSFNVLNCMGWDAFGLPAENFAIKNKKHPDIFTQENINTFKRQIKSFGPSFDWDREIDTTDPKYYKWTQWIFLELFKAGLAYEKKAPINWCTSCKTGLANEEVIDGHCERCDTQVEQKLMKQWFLAITKYADRLEGDLSDVNWPEYIKTSQKNWIGKSEGCEFEMKVFGNIDKKISVFTTRIDTVFGMTYAVIAPDHPQVLDLITSNQKESCLKYIEETKNKSAMERTQLNKDKSGVFSGSYVINPYNNEKVPLWIADYVLGNYGTGAVMAVPAHDERDFEFAKKYNLEIKQSIAPKYSKKIREGVETLNRKTVSSIIKLRDKYLFLKENGNGEIYFVGGGVDDGESFETAMKREIYEETGYKNIEIKKVILPKLFCEGFRTTKQKNQIVEDTFYYSEIVNDEKDEISQDEKQKHNIIFLDEIEAGKNISWEHHLYAWSLFINGEKAFIEDGILVNSIEFDGLNSLEARQKLTEFAIKNGFGKNVSNYKLRDWLFSRQRYRGEPIPLIHLDLEDIKKLPHISDLKEATDKNKAYLLKRKANIGENCEKVSCACGSIRELVIDGKVFSKIYDSIDSKLVVDERLPLVLPEIENYEPSGDGQSPLAKVDDFVNIKLADNLTGKRETNTMPQWAGSSWYFLRYIDPKNEIEFASKENLNYFMPVDIYFGGAEHTTVHLLYSRFWNKALYDLGIVPVSEPYKRRVQHGLIMGEDGRKMSKRWGNVINPDDVIAKYGADTMRAYIMFMGPYSEGVPWSDSAIAGVNRFINKVYNISEKIIDKDSEETVKLLHKTIKKISEDIENISYHTSISALMIFLNSVTNIGISKDSLKIFLQILAPFAPFITEEIWEKINCHPELDSGSINKKDSVSSTEGQKSIHLSSWPKYDENLVKDEVVIIGIQVLGKLRGELEININENKDEIILKAKEVVKKWLEGKEIVKEIYVPGKIVNIVVK